MFDTVVVRISHSVYASNVCTSSSNYEPNTQMPVGLLDAIITDPQCVTPVMGGKIAVGQLVTVYEPPCPACSCNHFLQGQPGVVVFVGNLDQVYATFDTQPTSSLHDYLG